MTDPEQGAEQEPVELTAIETFGLAVSIVYPRILIPLAAAFGASLFSDFGRHVDLALYSTVAQVSPVLALGGLIELGLFFPQFLAADMRRHPEDYQGRHDPSPVPSDSFVYEIVGTFALTETAALYAVAADETTTFLVLAALLGLVFQVGALVRWNRRRFDLVLERARERKRQKDPKPQV